MLEMVGTERIGFDDFRSNGLLLPANDTAAVRIGLPLHRGPHTNRLSHSGGNRQRCDLRDVSGAAVQFSMIIQVLKKF